MESSNPASEQLKRSRPSSSPDSSPDSLPPTDIIQNPAIPSLPSSSEEKIAAEKNADLKMIEVRNTIAADLKDRVPQLKLKPKVFEPNTFASWEKGEPIQFIFFALTCEAISQVITKRSMIQDILCNMYRTVMHTTPEDLIPVVYLSANSIAPAYEGLELEIDKNLIISALTEACGKHKQHVKNDHKAIRDLGELAQKTCSSRTFIKKRVDVLTIREVFNTLRCIAKESEKIQSKENCLENKKNYMKTLFAAAFDCEPKYIIRLLQMNLRLGFKEPTLLTALGQAAVYSKEHSISTLAATLKEASKTLKQVYSVLPNYDEIVSALLVHDVLKLSEICNFTSGVPVEPMLPKQTKGVCEVVKKFRDLKFTCEYKYDGMRAQIHYTENGLVEVYNRKVERITGKFPDVVAAVSRLKKFSVSSFVLDCVLVAYDHAKHQIISRRDHITTSDIKVDCIISFDMLYLNGKSLLQENLNIRREHLYASFKEESGVFQFATQITSSDVRQILKFLGKSVDASCDGLIIKTLHKDATYEPSKTSVNWLELKKDYMENIRGSLNLVPIAAFYDHGTLTGGYGAFLLACHDKDSDQFQSICKIDTIEATVLADLSASLRSKVIPKPEPHYQYAETIKPDVWFEACVMSLEVWEVIAAELTISPLHRAAWGVVDKDKGISIRSPQLLGVPPDKAPKDASSSEKVTQMYLNGDNG